MKKKKKRVFSSGSIWLARQRIGRASVYKVAPANRREPHPELKKEHILLNNEVRNPKK